MTQKSKPNDGPRPSEAEPLERLLKSEDPEAYGRLCWYLANRATVIHWVGDVIEVEESEPGDNRVGRQLRLTEESIHNIDRCLGMRTCGEASELFIEAESVEPTDECPNGHQSAAVQYLTYGIVPTKPCPECGEIPTFEGLTMSLDFRSSDAVKGTDGNVYRACPQCGDHMLELQEPTQ